MGTSGDGAGYWKEEVEPEPRSPRRRLRFKDVRFGVVFIVVMIVITLYYVFVTAAPPESEPELKEVTIHEGSQYILNLKVNGNSFDYRVKVLSGGPVDVTITKPAWVYGDEGDTSFFGHQHYEVMDVEGTFDNRDGVVDNVVITIDNSDEIGRPPTGNVTALLEYRVTYSPSERYICLIALVISAIFVLFKTFADARKEIGEKEARSVGRSTMTHIETSPDGRPLVETREVEQDDTGEVEEFGSDAWDRLSVQQTTYCPYCGVEMHLDTTLDDDYCPDCGRYF